MKQDGLLFSWNKSPKLLRDSLGPAQFFNPNSCNHHHVPIPSPHHHVPVGLWARG